MTRDSIPWMAASAGYAGGVGGTRTHLIPPPPDPNDAVEGKMKM